jgi:glycosyltransferase involved in cell wall biosynthesis
MVARPMISIVIPALNEEALLGTCLESLRRQNCRFAYEVIIVDGGCTDGTVEVAKRFGARVIAEKQPGVAAARNTGFTSAAGEIIASTDADTILPDFWLERIARIFNEKPGTIGVGGPWEYYDGKPCTRFWARVATLLTPGIMRVAPWMWSFSGFNFAVRKSAWERCGGFDTKVRYGEDFDLGRRLRKLGKVVYDHGLMVRTSGKAFDGDLVCIRMLANYLSLAFFGKIFLQPLVRSHLKQYARKS